MNVVHLFQDVDIFWNLIMKFKKESYSVQLKFIMTFLKLIFIGYNDTRNNYFYQN